MWFTTPVKNPDWSPAQKHLCKVHPAFKTIIKTVGPCTLTPRRDYFVVLCQAIFAQQLSTKVAAVLFGRFRDQFPKRRPTPARTITLLETGDEETIRRCGLSRQKRKYVLDLARHFESGTIKTSRLSRMGDDEIVAALTDVNGIGRWTTEMFLIFVLNRPDVWPVDDLGLRKGAQRAFKLSDMPKPKQLMEMGEAFRPCRTVATWYLWRLLETADADAKPVVKKAAKLNPKKSS